MCLKKQKYDLIFSLGAACSCTQILRRSNLQLSSYPLDWLFGSDFLGRVDILCNNFARFLNQEDLEYVFSVRSISCDAYHNKFNDLIFNHDFPANVDIKESYNEVHEKYGRRIRRLLKNIQSAEKILIAYIESPDMQNHLNDTDLLKGVQKIRDKYASKQVDFIFIISDMAMKPKTYEKKIFCDGVKKITGNYGRNKEGKPAWAINTRLVTSFFKKYRLNMPWQLRLKRGLAKMCIRLCPVKDIKIKIRKKYHV